jgi:hypothetical protein
MGTVESAETTLSRLGYRTRMDLSHSRRFYYMSGRFFSAKGFGLFKNSEHVP